MRLAALGTSVLFLVLLLGRVVVVGRMGQVAIHCGRCYASRALLHDLPMVGLVLLLMSGVLRFSRPVWRGACMLAAIVLMLLYAIDVRVFGIFFNRLHAADLLAYGPQAWMYLGPLRSSLIGGLVLVAGTLLVAMAMAGGRRQPAPRRPAFLALGGLVMLGVGFAVPEPPSFYAWMYQNLIEVNLPSGADREYSPAFVARVDREAPAPAASCGGGEPSRPDVVLVLVESLSSYQSDYFSGLNDWTPGLDSLARRGRAFTRFYANGATTAAGLIATLAGRDPLPLTRSATRHAWGDAFVGYYEVSDALPELLAASGYHTEFLTTGDLSFVDKSSWLGAIGFAFMEGHESPAYAGYRRYMFSAAPDEALYARAAVRIDSLSDAGQPFFVTLETVTTHPPFEDPVTGRISEELSFRYADRQLASFARRLASSGFLEHGMLLIMGDHRAMMPVSDREQAWGGRGTVARVPFVALGAGIRPGRVAAPFSQHDLRPSLQRLLQGRSCMRADEGDLFAAVPAPPAWILHVRGDERDVVDAYRTGDWTAVRLDGDETRVVAGDSVFGHTIVDVVNAARIASQWSAGVLARSGSRP